MADEKPTEVYERNGRDVAMWGVFMAPRGVEPDPVPTVWSSAYVDLDGKRSLADVEVGDFRLTLDLAEALANRILAAVRYERARAADGSTKAGA